MGIEPTCISYEPNMENEPTNIWMLLAKQSTGNRKKALVSQNEDANIDICFGPLKFPQKLQRYEGRQWLPLPQIHEIFPAEAEQIDDEIADLRRQEVEVWQTGHLWVGRVSTKIRVRQRADGQFAKGWN
jgi:hypothetical protein